MSPRHNRIINVLAGFAWLWTASAIVALFGLNVLWPLHR